MSELTDCDCIWVSFRRLMQPISIHTNACCWRDYCVVRLFTCRNFAWLRRAVI